MSFSIFPAKREHNGQNMNSRKTNAVRIKRFGTIANEITIQQSPNEMELSSYWSYNEPKQWANHLCIISHRRHELTEFKDVCKNNKIKCSYWNECF